MKANRKEAIQKFKERKVPRGVYSFRCASSGSTWIGASRNLGASNNGLRFMLRIGTYQIPQLQKEWNEYGESEFDFLVLEELADDVPDLLLNDLLKERAAYWAGTLGASALP